MEQPSAPSASSRGNRKRRNGKRKRSNCRQSEKVEDMVEEPPVVREMKKEVEKTSQSWNCPACTFLNEATRCFCETCETPNPSPSLASSRLGATSALDWSCAACTMVNPTTMRVCAVCGSLNPRPVASPGLKIRLSKVRREDENASLSSSSEDSEADSDASEEAADMWVCKSCDLLSNGRTCSKCLVQRPQMAINTKTDNDKKNSLLKKQKRRKRGQKLQERAKLAYGVSLIELKRLMTEASSSRLLDTLQTLTHTLAMMDASADNGWVDGPSFLIRGFETGRSDTATDSELLTLLQTIFQRQEEMISREVRLLALQSINYLMKLDRHIFTRVQMVQVVRLYINDLLKWNDKGSTGTLSTSTMKNTRMLVEECISGLSSVCSTEAFALREVLAHDKFVGFLDFLLRLMDENENDGELHPSIVMSALGILLKCCMKLRWTGKLQHTHRLCDSKKLKAHGSASSTTANMGGELTLKLATKLIVCLRRALQHKHVPLHVKAAKCLLLVFNRTPYDDPTVIINLVTPEVLSKFVAVVTKPDGEESDESRLAMVNLLLHLFDNRAQLVNMFVQEKIYLDLFDGMLQLLQSPSTALRTSTLRLMAMLTRVVCQKHTLGSVLSNDSKQNNNVSLTEGAGLRNSQSKRSRQRLDSLPDPDVLSTLLLEFIRNDYIAAVNVLLKDGADLNFPRRFDCSGNEVDKPLNVAVECASLEMVRLLFKEGADVHQVGIKGTPLHVAARFGRCDVAAFLLQCGARVQAKDRDKKTVMDVVSATDKGATKSFSVESIPSPMRKLLDLYQQSTDWRDFKNDFSESDEMNGGRNCALFYSSDHDDNGEDDDMDDDEFDEDEDLLMDYDDEEDEGFDSASQYDKEMGDDESSSDDDTVNFNGDMPNEPVPSDQRRLDVVLSGSFKSRKTLQNTKGCVYKRKRSLGACNKDCSNDDAMLEHQLVNVTADEVYAFNLAVTQCLLLVLHDFDVQKVERSIISTLACVLEMAPSQLIRDLKEADVVLILDTIHFLLQGDNHHQINPDVAKSRINIVTSSSFTAATHSNLLSYILAVRILQAMVRKSTKESSIFHQVERRGISKQIEWLNDATACWASTARDKNHSRSPCDTIFKRGFDLLQSLRADTIESGTLHLHKLRNLARRLKEFSDASSPCDQDLILVDLVDLFEDPNSITIYEFKQSELLPAILQYLSAHNELQKTRILALMQAFKRCPTALKHLITRLQCIITQEETFPLIKYSSGKGRELYPLTRQLKFAFVRSGDRVVGDRQHDNFASRSKEKSIHSSPLTHFQSFERMVFRSMSVIDPDLSLLYLNLVGHTIQKVVEGKWRKYIVVGYDDTRSYHLLKSIGGKDDSLVEMVLHDSQCKLPSSVDVYDSVALDLKLFGLHCVDSSGDKKKRKNNKRKRKLLSQKHLQAGRVKPFQVEIQNTNEIKLPSLPGAWYAAVLWNESDDVSKLSTENGPVCEEVLAAQAIHSVKLLADNRIIRKVPADCIRPRALQPQVGSVVEMAGGTFGEVVRVYDNDCASSNSDAVLLDVKMNSGDEKKQVIRNHVRFPPQEAFTPTLKNGNDQVKAMSIQSSFPARNNSSIVGSVGDRVWVLPPSGSSLRNLCVAGTIKNFSSVLDCISEISTVVVEVSFGSTQPPLAVKVNQDRILNFGAEKGVLSSRGSSRLLAALQMASDRGGSSKGFGGVHNGLNRSTSAIHRAFERVAGSLQQNQHIGRIGSSGTAMDQLRNYISRNSTIGASNAPSDINIPEVIQATTQSAAGTPLPNISNGSEVQSAILPFVSTSAPPTDKKFNQQRMSNGIGDSNVASCLKPQRFKLKMTCTQLPKVNLVVGFRNCDTNVTAQNRVVVSPKFGVDKANQNTLNAPQFDQKEPTPQLSEKSAGARKALSEIFSSFSETTNYGTSQKKKRRKVSLLARQKTLSDAASWDIERFIQFMQAVCGMTKYSHPGSNAKHCITFSKYADPATNRRLLKLDGFVSLITHEFKDAVKLKQLVQFLQSRGYSEKFLTLNGLLKSNGDDKEEKKAPNSVSTVALVKLQDSKMLRQPVVLRGFPADQSVLKCMETLHSEYRASACNSTTNNATSSIGSDKLLPPWKLTYKLYCDFQVEWETPSTSKSNDLLGPHASLLKTLADLESNSPARFLVHGIVALDGIDANGAADANRWLSAMTVSQACSRARDKMVVPESVASAVRLLRYLFQYRENAAIFDDALWTSPRLYTKLETQMQDVLSMCSCTYPPWCDALVTHCKFFFPRELREKLFRSTSFGCTRSLHWYRSQLNLEESSIDSVFSTVGSSIYNQEMSISPIPKERVKVHRANILQSAEAVMEMHAKRRAILDVVFVGEKGYGSGVTAEFYSSTAHALQVVAENRTKRYWIPGENDEAEDVIAELRQSDSAYGVDGLVHDATIIRHSNGLFPYPHRKADSKLIDRFRLMGRLAGKALMDERLLPLPLSPQFMKLVVGENFELKELGDIFLSHGRILYSMYKACQKLAAGEQNVQIDQMSIQEWLNAVDFTFIDPLSQEPLVIGGDGIAVSMSNLSVYVQTVLELWLDSGIRAQVLAFREGISEVLPVAKLRLLFVPELLSLLCGEQDITWDAASLAKDTKLAHGYTKDSHPVQWFFHILEEMPVTERRAFLLYATGCPNLPPGGFQALKPPFEVVRRVVDHLDVDRALPFARTCTNTLHLPAYTSKEVLAKQMAFAIANSRGAIDRD